MIDDDGNSTGAGGDQLEEMRETRRRGLAIANEAAADLRVVAAQLNSLRARPRPPVHEADPTEFYEIRIPAFLFDVATVDQTIGALGEHLLLMALRYEETARDLTATLAHLGTPGYPPQACVHYRFGAAAGARLSDAQFNEIAQAIGDGYGTGRWPSGLSDRAKEFLGSDGGTQSLLAELQAERQRNTTEASTTKRA